jgi:hypothetical protein
MTRDPVVVSSFTQAAQVMLAGFSNALVPKLMHWEVPFKSTQLRSNPDG